MEYIPLVLEPESRMYTDPVVVVDFQSLYPSIVIAYNLCFSTCVGRPAHSRVGWGVVPGTPGVGLPLGVVSYATPEGVLGRDLKGEDVTVTPNGVGFVPSRVRRGVMPRLLDEILNTR